MPDRTSGRNVLTIAFAACAITAAGCATDGAHENRVSARAPSKVAQCAPKPPARPLRIVYPGEEGWLIGSGPVYVAFVVEPTYRAAATGTGSTVGLVRVKGRSDFFVKVMTIAEPGFAGSVSMTIAPVHHDGRAAMSDGGRVDDDRFPRDPRAVTFAGTPKQFIPGGIRLSGPGCYRLTIKSEGFAESITFPAELRT